jgi:putative N6-adenine-specific DNA methylase
VQKPIKMLAKTLAGLEAVLVEELKSIGANEIVKANRAVAFEGDLKTLYQSIF